MPYNSDIAIEKERFLSPLLSPLYIVLSVIEKIYLSGGFACIYMYEFYLWGAGAGQRGYWILWD